MSFPPQVSAQSEQLAAALSELALERQARNDAETALSLKDAENALSAVAGGEVAALREKLALALSEREEVLSEREEEQRARNQALEDAQQERDAAVCQVLLSVCIIVGGFTLSWCLVLMALSVKW